MSVKVKVDTTKLDRLTGKQQRQRRQELYARRAAFLMRKFVPVRENTLRASEPLNSNYKQGYLMWNTPYAAKHYYVPMHHTHPGVCDHWDQAMMKQHGDDLKEFAEKLFTEV